MIWRIGFYYLGYDVIGQFVSLGENHRYIKIPCLGASNFVKRNFASRVSNVNRRLDVTRTQS